MNLRGRQKLLMILSCVIVMVSSTQTAQGGMRKYLKENFVNVTGRVQGSFAASPRGTHNVGFHLTLRTTFQREYIIHVGPQWYVDNNPRQFNFKKGDLITVSGAQFATGRTQNNIYAATVVNHSSGILKLQLRNPDTGAGLWRGRFKKQIRGAIRNKMMIIMREKVKASIARRTMKKDKIRLADYRTSESASWLQSPRNIDQ